MVKNCQYGKKRREYGEKWLKLFFFLNATKMVNTSQQLSTEVPTVKKNWSKNIQKQSKMVLSVLSVLSGHGHGQHGQH